MTAQIEAKLAELGITLPEAAAPAANYVPFLKTGNQLYISGQLPMTAEGIQFKGKLGEDFTADEGSEAARLCAINLIAQMKAATGDLEKIARIVKLGGFVNSTADFGDQPAVINGASNLMVDVFGEKGRHARSAVSAAALPFGVAVEIDAIVELAD
ncbi:RidA family protein [Cohaesibacter gelatinilyticus]|uniref:Enamine deaminase RidA, house cleaning of reactive enamine intermediates, YjgF/YER057c/UK114 family n=1 Tax=Cohaesibacter gelatinilyticus TaxID=372072 RepID=A0A285NKR6_9HYPH|nr:RidA family protein [Cohaesibacter gelatinilyticus]SNZ08241.1 Enamine deaminase RidA, house cleaning of reactive enamine intermediates, YjgF/YER057c/UK114 family [Cohaesibacter gelatinilyticus]HAT88147.1 RidA family protein [Hyphomicrobiales bacterium]